jgi:hypothetical protein
LVFFYIQLLMELCDVAVLFFYQYLIATASCS